MDCFMSFVAMPKATPPYRNDDSHEVCTPVVDLVHMPDRQRTRKCGNNPSSCKPEGKEKSITVIDTNTKIALNKRLVTLYSCSFTDDRQHGQNRFVNPRIVLPWLYRSFVGFGDG